MALFDFLKRVPVDQFAEQLALDLAKRYEPALELDPTKKRNPQRLAKAFDSTFNRAVQFQQKQKLGVYGKARLSGAFKWKLKELGYPEDFVELATSAMTKFLGNQR